MLELQKVKQEVSGRGFAHVWGVGGCAPCVWGAPPELWPGGLGMQPQKLPAKASVSVWPKAAWPESQLS